MSRHGCYKEIGGGTYWEPANPNCFYGEDCATCNPGGIYSYDDDSKPPEEYAERYVDGRFSRWARSGPPTPRMKFGSPQTTSWSRARDSPT